MDKLQAMRAFSTVVATGSFAAAGRQLGLTRSAVSKGVMELEHLLGARLLDRTTRRVSPTEAGSAYNHRCIDILAQIDETELQVSRLHDEPKGVLRVNAPTSFGILHLGSAVSDFMSSHADIKVELLLNDRFVDPLEEGVDVTIRIATLEDSSLVARKLAMARRVMVASPAYLETHGVPSSPDDLVDHRCLNYGYSTSRNDPQRGSSRCTLFGSGNNACIDVSVSVSASANESGTTTEHRREDRPDIENGGKNNVDVEVVLGEAHQGPYVSQFWIGMDRMCVSLFSFLSSQMTVDLNWLFVFREALLEKNSIIRKPTTRRRARTQTSATRCRC